MTYLNQIVLHNTLGKGVIVAEAETIIFVRFGDKEIKFAFPECFERFVEFQDQKLQAEITKVIKKKHDAAKQKEAEEKQQFYEQRQKIQKTIGNSTSKRSKGSAATGIYILNFQGPSSYDELKWFYEEFDEKTNLEELLEDAEEGTTHWTVPKFAKIGDRVLFYCASTSTDTYHLGNAIYEATERRDKKMMAFGERERRMYSSYAGTIMCTGIITGNPYKPSDSAWSEKLLYAEIGKLQLIDNAVTSREINHYLKINRYNSVTSVKPEQWKPLKELIMKRNPSIKL